MRRALFLLAVLAASLTSCFGDRPSLNAGDGAPSFELKGLDGKTVRYPGDFAGRAVIIRFWADWCPHCSREMSEIDPVAMALEKEGVTMLAINAGQSEATVRAFVEKHGIHYRALVDEKADVNKAYGVIVMPTTFFIRPDGRIHNKGIGEAKAAVFEKMARELVPFVTGRP